jgi:hypothetical protein
MFTPRSHLAGSVATAAVRYGAASSAKGLVKRMRPSMHQFSTDAPTSADSATINTTTTTDHHLVGVTLPDHVWAPQVEPALLEVQAILDRKLEDLRTRSQLPQWDAAMDTICKIASSKHRHLLVPQVFLLGAVGGTGNLDPLQDKGMWQFAASLELHHLFMLVADDSMDSAKQRRGVTTVNHMLAQR